MTLILLDATLCLQDPFVFSGDMCTETSYVLRQTIDRNAEVGSRGFSERATEAMLAEQRHALGAFRSPDCQFGSRIHVRHV